MMKSVKLLKSSSFDEISKVIEDAMKLGTDNNFGHDYHKDALQVGLKELIALQSQLVGNE